MKIVVTHTAPDWDAITSVWVIKKYLPGWNEAEVEFVPAGTRSPRLVPEGGDTTKLIEKAGHDEIIHVDTGLGPLDHHQTSDKNVSAASLSWDYVKIQEGDRKIQNPEKLEGIDRMVKVVVDIDHFKEVFWDNPTADYHEFSLIGLLEGAKSLRPDDDDYLLHFGMECLDAMLHNFESRVWAEHEINETGREFETKWGKAVGFETVNDTVLKLAQKMGYRIVLRKDPRKGYVRIKARPAQESAEGDSRKSEEDIDLTPVYEKLKEKDPEATWFLHVSKKMLLNGTAKNPKMRPSNLSLDDIIEVIKSV